MEEPFVRPSSASATVFDCFYVYPTVNLLNLRFNFLDLSDVSTERYVTKLHAGRFSQVCRVFAPFYRQATGRNYNVSGGPITSRLNQTFDMAYGDVEAAFDHYLTNYNNGRPFALLGHSQGAQMVTQLLLSRFAAGSPLRNQLVVAMPIGWGVSTSTTLPASEAGDWTWDPIPPLPLCVEAADTGCIIAYRSYAGVNPMEHQLTVGGGGKKIACVNPVVPGVGVQTLSGSFFGTQPLRSYVTAPPGFSGNTLFLEYPNMYIAQCTESGDNSGLEILDPAIPGDVRANPVNFNSNLLNGARATHGLDVSFALQDLISTAAARALAVPITPAPTSPPTEAPTNSNSGNSASSSEEDNATVTLSISIVVAVIVIAAIVGVFMMSRRNRHRKTSQSATSPVFNDTLEA